MSVEESPGFSRGRGFNGLSARDIWESLRAGKSLDPILDIAPDEMYDWIRTFEKDFITAKDGLMMKAQGVARDARKLTTRREQAEYVLSHAKTISGVVFPLLDEKVERAEQAAWGMLKPSGKCFKREGNEK